MSDRPARRIVLLLLFSVVAVFLLIVLRSGRKPREAGAELPTPAPAPVSADTSVPPRILPRPAPVGAPDTLPVRISRRRVLLVPPPVRPLPPDTLRVEMGVDEYIRDFYGDVKERTLTLLLTESRIDTAGPLRWMFRRGLTGDERSPIRRFVVAVDSVHPLRKYIFPGWGYGSDWAPLPDGSIGLEGGIEPKAGIYRLSADGAKDLIPANVERKDDRVSVRLRSLPGYTYFIRFGIDYAGTGAKDTVESVYTVGETVEFPLILRCGSLAQEVHDTLFIATSDPRAIHEVAATVPNAAVVAVLLDADPDADWAKGDLTPRSDVSIFLNSTTPRGESFVILNSSEALVERRAPDPAFDRIVRTHLAIGLHGRSLADDDPARPILRRTDLLRVPEGVTSLMRLFRQYVRESGKRM